jgi:DNA topoisomerase-1
MAKNLVIVESPAKAKTIEKFLGSDYTVKSCFGHIRDLAEGELSVDVTKNFEPKYIIPEDKKKIVSELKKLAKEAEIIWLATDEDREGEAISWHLKETLELKDDKIKRIVFHEITKPAILKAIDNPRTINNNLVNAQQARRILDRLVGFEVSPILWKKIQPALSAGRVQSVAVRLIVEREREIIAHSYKSSYKISAAFYPVDANGKKSESTLNAELPQRYDTRAEAYKFLQTCMNAAFSITDIEVKPATKSPSPPFTTSTLQQEASRKLGYSVTRTMIVAQKLYEAGHITYMRTDSVNLSEIALADIKAAVTQNYGEKYSKQRQYTTKSASAQEAHEAIRPTYINVPGAGNDDAEKRLYDLIWKRTIASQMANAILEKTNVKIKVSTSPLHLLATGEVLKFDGFLKVYIEQNDEEEDEDIKGMLPPLNVGQKLDFISMEALERYNRPAPRYTEASLVKKLEELGIGRPSTYAPTITTIQKRGYVIKGDQDGTERPYGVLTLKNSHINEQTKTEVFGREKSKLFPSNIGMMVNDFLVTNFEKILDYGFTAGVEKEFDEIANGSVIWQKMLGGFYTPFHQIVEDTIKTSSRVKSERLVGADPATGKNVYAKIGKFGPLVQIGETATEEAPEKPKYAKLRAGQLIESITIDEAMELFRLPREIGQYEDSPVVASIGRFGPYISHAKAFYSLAKTDDPYTVEIARAIELIDTKRIEKENKTIHTFEYEEKPLLVLNGRFGPYISFDKGNYKIPKGTDTAKMTADDSIAIIIANPETTAKAAKFRPKVKAAPKTKAAPKAKAKTGAKKAVKK